MFEVAEKYEESMGRWSRQAARRYLTGEGLNGAYFQALSDDRKATLKEKLREILFGNRPDGPFSLQAKTWAVKGVAP